jgi:hypothetical protein
MRRATENVQRATGGVQRTAGSLHQCKLQQHGQPTTGGGELWLRRYEPTSGRFAGQRGCSAPPARAHTRSRALTRAHARSHCGAHKPASHCASATRHSRSRALARDTAPLWGSVPSRGDGMLRGISRRAARYQVSRTHAHSVEIRGDRWASWHWATARHGTGPLRGTALGHWAYQVRVPVIRSVHRRRARDQCAPPIGARCRRPPTCNARQTTRGRQHATRGIHARRRLAPTAGRRAPAGRRRFCRPHQRLRPPCGLCRQRRRSCRSLICLLACLYACLLVCLLACLLAWFRRPTSMTARCQQSRRPSAARPSSKRAGLSGLASPGGPVSSVPVQMWAGVSPASAQAKSRPGRPADRHYP